MSPIIGKPRDPHAALIRHYRREHGWGIRRISRELNVRESWVKEVCDLMGRVDL